jgi:BirA family biotin operon repressor/biotin-[acetyl-CoA-carboxylase] ligase
MLNSRSTTPIIHRLISTPSTQLLAVQRAAQLITDHPSPPVGYCEVWTAETQLRGRGQHHRPFASPPGGFYASLLMAVERNLPIEVFPLAVGWKCSQALAELGCNEIAIRWPNDLCLNEKKIGGILCQSVVNDSRCFVVVGVGINTRSHPCDFPPELRPFITTFAEHGLNIEHDVLLQNFLARALELLDAEELLNSVSQSASLDVTRGRHITVVTDGFPFEGVSHGWGRDGHLRLLTSQGARELSSATICQIDGKKVRMDD